MSRLKQNQELKQTLKPQQIIHAKILQLNSIDLDELHYIMDVVKARTKKKIGTGSRQGKNQRSAP